jgi:hypothetical protein
MEGPDQILAGENLTTTKPDGNVKIRETGPDAKEYFKPMSLVTFITQQVCSKLLLSNNKKDFIGTTKKNARKIT